MHKNIHVITVGLNNTLSALSSFKTDSVCESHSFHKFSILYVSCINSFGFCFLFFVFLLAKRKQVIRRKKNCGYSLSLHFLSHNTFSMA